MIMDQLSNRSGMKRTLARAIGYTLIAAFFMLLVGGLTYEWVAGGSSGKVGVAIIAFVIGVPCLIVFCVSYWDG